MIFIVGRIHAYGPGTWSERTGAFFEFQMEVSLWPKRRAVEGGEGERRTAGRGEAGENERERASECVCVCDSGIEKRERERRYRAKVRREKRFNGFNF